MVVLELLHLKMEVTVSEPCDVIRVGKIYYNIKYFQNSPQPTIGHFSLLLFYFNLDIDKKDPQKIRTFDPMSI